MLKCPICGFRNPQSNDRCLKCSALLKRDTDIINQAMYDGAQKAKDYRRSNRLAGIVERLQRLVDFPSWRVRDDLPYRYPFTAGLLSILPGCGQVYNRQLSKGFAFAMIWLLGLCIAIWTIRAPYSNWLLVLLVLGWLGIWNDAVSTAIRTNGQSWPLRNSLAMFCAILFSLGMLINAMQFFGMSFLTLVKVQSDVHRPTIAAGDRLWVNHLAYLFSEPDYGDVIDFDPERFTAEQGADVVSINIGKYVQRVVGKEGDIVEIRDGQWFRNDIQIPEWQRPFGDEVLSHGTFRVPTGCVFAPITKIPPELGYSLLASAAGNSFSPVMYAFQPGYIFQKWDVASMPKYDQIWGRGVAIVDPPRHREWLNP